MALSPEETLSTLRKRSADLRRAAEVRAGTVRAEVIAAVAARLPPGGRAWLIGSLAWGGFGERSDVDLVFDSVDAMLVTEIELQIAGTSKVFVDTLMLADLPSAFRDRVLGEGLPIHGH
jgi:predicted nucleotidyltransferase